MTQETEHSAPVEIPPDLSPSGETVDFLLRIFNNYEADPAISAALQRDDELFGSKPYQADQNI